MPSHETRPSSSSPRAPSRNIDRTSDGTGGITLSQAIRPSMSTSPTRLSRTLPIPQLIAEPSVRTNPTALRSGPRALVQGERDEEDREERLGLDDDRGQTRRRAVGEGEELQQELAGEQRQAERHERAPGERPSEPDRRRGRDQKSD